VKLSVLIPTCDRPDLLDRCLASLSRQAFDGFEAEVVVGIDGEDSGEVEAARRRATEAIPMRALPGLHAGPAATRNRIVREAAGETLLFLNDDVEAMPGLLDAHVRAQRRLTERGRTAMVLGAAPWAVEEPDRVIDRLTRETSLIFFYDQMTGAKARGPEHDWGWRHAWTLNLSLPAHCVREVGGFNERMLRPVYEDIELAFRVRERFDAPTLFRPGARVLHRHRYEPVGLLAREYVLGHQSRRLAEVSPRCAAALFQRDPLCAVSVREASATELRRRREVAPLLGQFIDSSLAPADSVDDAGLASVYSLYTRCRTYLRALGLADAASGKDCHPPLDWLEQLASARAA